MGAGLVVHPRILEIPGGNDHGARKWPKVPRCEPYEWTCGAWNLLQDFVGGIFAAQVACTVPGMYKKTTLYIKNGRKSPTSTG